MDKKMAYYIHVKLFMILVLGFSQYSILQTKSGLVKTVPKIANDSRNFEVRQISDIFGCMSLCNGNAATMLEIASNLTFNKKTYTRAFVEYYRQGVDILQTTWNINKEYSNYFENEYFLRDRSYGSMEIIIVEMSFRRKQFVERFRNSNVGSDHLSDYLEYAEREFERPSRVKVIRLSTADDKFEMYKFRKRNFQQAVNAVKRYELEILRIREDIIRNYTKPHLNYGMLPYLPSAVSSIRSRQSSSDHLLWEKMTEAEVLVNQRLVYYKHIKRRCNRAKISVCTNLRSIKRMLKIMKKDLHKRRSKWYLSTNEQKTETPKLIKNLRRCNKELRNCDL
ncbi:hypothetical protein KUTeg_012486 [Tegillarca granosa]|uniref:Uncharacterized protein n=1 Tax=Tegillarca granosa TaxID=220873 RepID=A0ABQ9F240_TEGGR|nr:hypothetical protein KUTeg_012486 [Tegillarca granosa]